MGDEPRIHVERVDAESGGWSGSGGSSHRVVQEPNRWTRAAAVLVVAGLVVGGLVGAIGGGGDGPEEHPPASAREAYTAAVARLGRARSFAYSGTVHATERSPLRPGAWLDDELSVEGAVLLPHSITRELASLPGGGPAVETVTSGATAWSRVASSRSALPGGPWVLVAADDPRGTTPSAGDPVSLGSNRLGVALVSDVLRSAVDPHGDPPGANGRRELHATVPEDVDDERFADLLAGARVMVGLDEAGDITDLRVTTLRCDCPSLDVELAIGQLGEADLITAGDVGRPARDALPVTHLVAAGLQPLDLSWLPSGWALTDARQARAEESCPVLLLDYHDLTEVSDGELSLTVMSEGCVPGPERVGSGEWGEPFRAGELTGRVEESTQTVGTVSDGETVVSFSTDLSAADAEVLLTTLVPFDAATQPAVLPGIPSS